MGDANHKKCVQQARTSSQLHDQGKGGKKPGRRAHKDGVTDLAHRVAAIESILADNFDLRNCVQKLEADKIELLSRVAELESKVKHLNLQSEQRIADSLVTHQGARLFSDLFSSGCTAAESDMPDASAYSQKEVGAAPAILMSKLVSKVSEKIKEKAQSDKLMSSNVTLIGVCPSNNLTDEQQVRQIFRYMGKEQQSVLFSRRLGSSEVAPILCKLADPVQKNSVLASARNLKGTEYDRVFIRPDLSAEDREEAKKLRQERDLRNSACGEGRQREWWRIRTGKLVPYVIDNMLKMCKTE